MTIDNAKKEYIERASTEAAAFAVKQRHYDIDGTAVIMMASYLRTCKLSDSERDAALGHAFDIFAGAVKQEKS